MNTLTQPAVDPAFSEEDHHTWARLYAAQWARMPAYACRLFLSGFPQLGLDPQRLPDKAMVSARLQRLSGWTLGDAQNEYLNPEEWFAHIAERRFPVTNYIRKPDEIEFTPLPDLFHEYFGHLAFFTDRRFGDIAQSFGPLYFAADERQRLEISRLWWFTTEFGLIHEGSSLKAFGAGLLSSIAELDKAFAPHTTRRPFDIRAAAEMPSAVYEMHNTYFIIEGIEHIAQIIRDYARMESLPIPHV